MKLIKAWDIGNIKLSIGHQWHLRDEDGDVYIMFSLFDLELFNFGSTCAFSITACNFSIGIDYYKEI